MWYFCLDSSLSCGLCVYVTAAIQTPQMASNSSEPDPKVISSIVDRLKKQGLFDKFRKECLADVDTKVTFHVTLP